MDGMYGMERRSGQKIRHLYLGGGGSRSSAAVQLHDVSVAQAVQMARAAIDDNLEN